MILQYLVHKYAKLHITLIVRKYAAKPMRNYIHILNYVQVAYKIFSIWSLNPYSSTHHQFFVACSHKAPYNPIH